MHGILATTTALSPTHLVSPNRHSYYRLGSVKQRRREVDSRSRLNPAPLLMGEIWVWIASLDLEGEPAERLSRLLSDDEQERAARFHMRRDAVRFRVHRAALRTILAECLGVEPRAVDFRYGPRGKPELVARFDRAGLRFNA